MTYKRDWWRVGLSAFALALVAFAFAGPASAQEQVGAITGTVSDTSGAVLPGATVEAVGSSGFRLTSTTAADGTYRFPRVPPGVYSVTAKLDGFNPAEVTNVTVTLGDTVTANMGLEVGVVSETISVVGEAGQVDVRSSATATSITAEQMNLLPKGRDFTNVATQAAGASNETFAGGLSIDGSTASENKYVIDGMDTTHPETGLSGQRMVTDFLEEVQVKSAGYQAEYGGSTGGVINVVTQSGSNEFKGWVGAYYSDRDWDGDEHALPYRGWESSGTIYRTFDEISGDTLEPGFALGGPIAQDKAWFFLGYTRSEFDSTLVPVVQATPTSPKILRPEANQTDTRENYSGNIKGNIGSQFLYKVSGNFAPRTLDNALPARDGSTPASAPLNIDNDFEAESYSAYADWIPSDNFYMSARAGFFTTDQHTSGELASERIFFRDRSFPIVGDPRYRPANFATVPAAALTGTEFDLWERTGASLDGNLFVNGLGTHAFKGGVQYEKIYNDVADGEVGNLYTIRWGLADRFGAGVQGTYGSLGVRRFGTFGESSTTGIGLYLQDSWQVLPNLTVNVGVRSEQEEVPFYGHATDPSTPENLWDFDFADKIAPRIGFAWDIFSDQKLKIYGSWGTYYDSTKLAIRGSTGGDKWIEYLWPLETLNWEGVSAGCHNSTNDPTDNPCPGLGNPEATLDLRHPSDPRDPDFGVDPNIQPFEQEEFQVGADYQLTANSVVGFRYVDKSVKAAIEDIGSYICNRPGPTDCIEGYVIGNPGLGVTADDPPGPIPATPKARRDYEAVELTWNRRFAENWSARVGYTWSSLEGNYTGLGSSDEFGRTDPNVSRQFDYLHNSFNQNGQPVYGPLNTNRENQIDAQFIYRFGWGTSIGVNQYYGSGQPISTQINYAGVPFFAYGRGDVGETDDLTQTDLLIAHPFKIGDFTLEASLNITNLFDEDTALLIDPYPSDADICDDPACEGTAAYFFENLVPFESTDHLDPSAANPFYLQPNVRGSFPFADPYQARRAVRVGLKFMF